MLKYSFSASKQKFGDVKSNKIEVQDKDKQVSLWRDHLWKKPPDLAWLRWAGRWPVSEQWGPCLAWCPHWRTPRAGSPPRLRLLPPQSHWCQCCASSSCAGTGFAVLGWHSGKVHRNKHVKVEFGPSDYAWSKKKEFKMKITILLNRFNRV